VQRGRFLITTFVLIASRENSVLKVMVLQVVNFVALENNLILKVLRVLIAAQVNTRWTTHQQLSNANIAVLVKPHLQKESSANHALLGNTKKKLSPQYMAANFVLLELDSIQLLHLVFFVKEANINHRQWLSVLLVRIVALVNTQMNLA
jgi:hypothetical protein